MGDVSGTPDPSVAASTSLRETAKWMIGGVTVTAAGVFAGSSLTRFGSLDVYAQPVRLAVAALAFTMGFLALAYILRRAIGVMTVESFSFRELATAQTEPLVGVRRRLDTSQAGALPGRAGSLADLISLLDEAWQARDDLDDAERARRATAFLADFDAFRPVLMREAGFLNVKAKFDLLVTALWRATPFAMLGFGAFAWAANPPDHEVGDKPITININLASPMSVARPPSSATAKQQMFPQQLQLRLLVVLRVKIISPNSIAGDILTNPTPAGKGAT